MTTTVYLDGTDGLDSNSGVDSANPKQTISGLATANTFPDTMILYLKTGTTISAGTSILSTPSNASLTFRSYGGGARPTVTARGFVAAGTGSIDVQDVDFDDAVAGEGVCLQAKTGGNMSVVNSDIHGFGTAIKCGTGTVYVNNIWCDKPASNGFQLDCPYDKALATSVQVLNSRFTAASPTAQDLLVLHDGGIGLLTGAVVAGNRIEALGGAYVESGIDVQQQFKGALVYGNTVVGSSQWGLVMGSLYKGGSSSYTFNTKAQMLAAFSREGTTASGTGVGTGATIIHCGHCAWVTADGGNNGLYQLTGNDPNVAGGWTGPIAVADMADSPNLIYGNRFIDCVAGVQVQHPGSQIVANVFLGTTLGNWYGPDVSNGSGNVISFYDMGYDCLVMDNVFATASGKYTEIGADGDPTGTLLTSTKAAVQIKAIHARIAQRSRAVFTGNVVRMRAEHEGPFVEFVDADDATYFDSDYNAFIADVGVSDGTWPEFCDDAGTARTFSAFKTANSSDSHSFFQTPETAVIDSECRPGDGSTLIAAGVARAGLDGAIPATDSEGNALSSPPDIGGYRYLSEAVAATIVPTLRRILRALRAAGSAPVDLPIPGAVTGLAATASDAVTLVVSCDATTDAAFYQFRHSIAGLDSWVESSTTAELFASLSVDGGTTYDVQVRAGNGAGNGPWSASVQATTAASVWYLPQEVETRGFQELPPLAERYMASGATSNPGAYDTAGVYTLLTDNGGAAGGVALVAVDDNTERKIDAAMSLMGMASDHQWLIAMKASHELSAAQSFWFVYGCHSSLSSMYGLHVSASDVVTFTSRGLGESASTNTAMTRDSGPVYGDFDGQGEYTVLLNIRAVSTTAVDVQVKIVHDTVGTSVWSASGIACGDDANSLPGITASQTASEFGGLMLGARMKSIASAGEPEKFFGIGTGHTATIGTFQARKWGDYDAGRIDDAAAAILADPAGWWLA